MIHNLTDKDSILHQFIGEMRDHKVQTDRMRFRKNMRKAHAQKDMMSN